MENPGQERDAFIDITSRHQLLCCFLQKDKSKHSSLVLCDQIQLMGQCVELLSVTYALAKMVGSVFCFASLQLYLNMSVL